MQAIDLVEPETWYLPQPPGSRPRTIYNAETPYIYGQTPTKTKQDIFRGLATKFGISDVEMARRVAKMKFEERMDMVEEYSLDIGLDTGSVVELVGQAREEYRGELKKGALRRISYNQPLIQHFTHKRKPTFKLPSNKRSRKHSIGSTTDGNTEETFSDDDDILKQLYGEHSGEGFTAVATKEVFTEEDDDESLLNTFNEEKILTKKKEDSSATRILASSSTGPPPTTTTTGLCIKTTAETDSSPSLSFFDRKYTIKPAPPGQFYRSSRPSKPPESADDELDLIFDDSQEFNKAVANQFPSRAERRDPSRTPVSAVKYGRGVSVDRCLRDDRDTKKTFTRSPDNCEPSFDSSGDSLLDQIFPSP